MLIKLDLNRIRLLKLEVNADSIKYRLVSLNGWALNQTVISKMYFLSICTSKLRVKPTNVNVVSDSIITVSPTPSAKSSMYHVLQHLKDQLKNVVIKVSFFFSKPFLQLY